MSVPCLIQARVNSSRLPRKSLALIGCRASVFHVWKRAREAVGMAFVVTPWDDAGEMGAVIPPGWLAWATHPETADCDVLGRFALAVAEWPNIRRLAPRTIVRLTADCPFVDPAGIRAVAKAVELGADYAYLDPVPNGLDAEAFTADLLMRAHREATDPYDREHVTSWMRKQSVKIVRVPMFADLPRYRWTLDTPGDLAWFTEVDREIDCTPPHPTVPDLLALMERRPDLVRMDT